MRVLHITTNYPTTEHPAFGTFVQSQVESLRAQGVECSVFYVNGRGSLLRYISAYFRLLWHLLTHRYELLHAHHALSGILLWMTCAPLFTPSILSYQNEVKREWGWGTFYLLAPFFRRIIFKSAPSSAPVALAPVAPASSAPQALSPSAFPIFGKCFCKKVRVIPNGCDSSMFVPIPQSEAKQCLGLEEEKQYILFIDSNLRARHQKREDRFDAVLSHLKTKFPRVEPLKLRSVAPEKMPLYFNAAEMYLLCSDYEGSPNAVKECLMCNRPVVATPVGDLPYLSQHCPACVVADFSEEGLGAAAEKILTKERGEGASREALLSLGYGLESTAQKLLGLYQEILK
ncbi:MAG: glycosyltransferase [Bacteroidales bacterium]|nr:glycosyltransferase [Bacteroidales bacterium]